MTDIVKADNKEVKIFDDSANGLELLDKAVSQYSSMLGKPKGFIMSAFVKGNAMGIKNPMSCIASFWDFGTAAEIKTDALQKHLLDNNFILEPFKVIDDCVPVYEYYDQDVFDKFILEHGKAFFIAVLKDKSKTPWETIAKILLKTICYAGSDPEVKAKGTEKRTNLIVDYKTTLEATVFDYKRDVITKQHSYLYSTAEAKGIPFEGDKMENGKRKLKTVWKDKSWMMYKRCAGQLSGIVAPGAAYGTEGIEGYEHNGTLEKEHALHVSANGENPNIKDISNNKVEETVIIDITPKDK